uniref:peptidylprolyl isomerase n=1 Tax=Cuerna arida TaxID=1464854 RepID=A0A1B6FIC3_9HEMI
MLNWQVKIMINNYLNLLKKNVHVLKKTGLVNNQTANFSSSFYQPCGQANRILQSFNIKEYLGNVPQNVQVRVFSKKTQNPTSPTEVSEYKAQENISKRKTLEGGVIVADITIGNGVIAKNGKTISVYYRGKLKSTSKVFDEVTSGPGLTFRLGRGDVIDGWDIGVVGMKVGGRRVITCPPAMAYGVKGYPPAIPPNSTLVFEVELKDVK